MELKTILLAEDDPKDAALTMEALQENNLLNTLVRVKDGAEALEYLEQKGQYSDRTPGLPAVLLLDLHMPKMDGLETLAVIRQSSELKRLPVVMLTSSQEEEDLIRSYDLGVNAYVVKPVDLNEFVGAIKQLGLFWGLINKHP
ncbi:response regulator [Sunxiuqinia elliptica]